MPIKDRNLKPGTRLIARYHKQAYTCEVVEGEGGKVHYSLPDGREFKSASAAGTAVTGQSCNGWAFWSLEMSEDTPQQQEVIEDTEPTGEVTTGIYKLPNQKGAPEGQTRWYCRACKQGFLVPSGETPTACPTGPPAC